MLPWHSLRNSPCFPTRWRLKPWDSSVDPRTTPQRAAGAAAASCSISSAWPAAGWAGCFHTGNDILNLYLYKDKNPAVPAQQYQKFLKPIQYNYCFSLEPCLMGGLPSSCSPGARVILLTWSWGTARLAAKSSMKPGQKILEGFWLGGSRAWRV